MLKITDLLFAKPWRGRTQLPNYILASQVSLGYMLGHVLFILGTRQLLLLSASSMHLAYQGQVQALWGCSGFLSITHAAAALPFQVPLIVHWTIYPPDSTMRVICWLKWMYPYQETFRQWKYFLICRPF